MMDTQFFGSSNFGPVFNFAQGQGPAMHYPESQYPIYTGFPGLQYMYASQQPPSEYPSDRNSLSDGKTESKPRLSKDEVERLENIFSENPKPSSSVKAQLADELGLERPRINNWFQNRRAKAKQERKQEEYEARRAAEKSGPEIKSPAGVTCGVAEAYEREPLQHTKSFPASFSRLDPSTEPTHIVDDDVDCGDDNANDSEDADSPFVAQAVKSQTDSISGELQSPLSLDISQTEDLAFSYAQTQHTYSAPGSMQSYASFQMPDHEAAPHGLPSPEEQLAASTYQAEHYLKAIDSGYPGSALPFYQSRVISDDLDSSNDLKPESVKEEEPVLGHADQSMPSVLMGVSIPENSFKSPPPPANIATRRNIPRPATLQVGNARSRSYNLGPKTGMDTLRRTDPTSPATAMRRIASAGGNMAGRIQKQCAGSRSPLFLNRNTEAFFNYHSRSPVGVLSAAFSGASPPTPMTPAVMSQGGREPTVSSTCSDDDAFMLGHGIESLKTPPETPGILGNLPNNFNGHAFTTGMDFAIDQPLLTPYIQTDFPDLSLRHIPSYVDMSDSSLPSTPLYPNMMNSIAQNPNCLATAGPGNAQFDWDANESITSTKSSPGQPQSRQIQFTPNMTPQDYNGVQER